MSTASLTLTTTDGLRLPARLRLPDVADPVGAAVLCHPHPAFGGSMDVWLIPRIGLRLATSGWAVLRFDFRDDVRDGHPAVADLAAAVDEARRHATGRVALVGWSFGALVAALYGPSDERITDWVGIAPPTQARPRGWSVAPLALPPTSISEWQARRTVIVGEHDQFYPPCEMDRYDPHATHVIADTDHFFFDRDDEIADLVATVLAET